MATQPATTAAKPAAAKPAAAAAPAAVQTPAIAPNKGNGETHAGTIVAGATVNYTAKVKGKPDVIYPGLLVKSIGKVGNNVRATVTDAEGKEHDLAIETLTFVSAPPAEKIKAPRIKKEFIPYERALINSQVKKDREAGKTRLYPDKTRYATGQSDSPDARKTIDIGDSVAVMLRATAFADLYTVAEGYVGAERVAELKVKYADKNPGMVRMNIGNIIRGSIRAGERAKFKADADAQAAAVAEAAAKAAPATATPPVPAKPAAKKVAAPAAQA